MTWVRIYALATGIGLTGLLTEAISGEHAAPSPSTAIQRAGTSERETLVWPAELGPWAPAEDIHRRQRGYRTGAEFAGYDAVQATAVVDAEEEGPGRVAPGRLPEEVPLPSDVAVDDASILATEEGCGGLWTDVWGVCQSCCDAGLVLGVEGMFLAPFGEPVQRVTLTDLTTEQVLSGNAHPSFGAGVRTWLGLQRGGWGFRVQYSHFGNEEIDPHPNVPVNAEPTFLETYYLRAYSVDIELTQGLCFGEWRIDSSFGGRFAKLERNGTVVGYGTLGNGVNLYGLAMGANEIEGPGFTFSLGGRRPLHGCWLPCGWSLFWQYRGSLLWADSTASVLTEANAITKDPVGAANSRDKAFASKEHSEDVYISEIQLGIQYERCLPCCPGVFFFRAGLEYQHWVTGDVVAQSNSFAFLQGGPSEFGGRVDAFSYAHDGDLDLIGFMLGTGLTY